jgi:acid phosphatase family membrane protein YuiD
VNYISEIFFNKAITVPALAWLIAQTLKVINVIWKERKLDFTRFVGSGGMPSSHSAFIMSLTAVIGKNNGWNSELFALSFAVALIVMYDAAGIRRAAGKQAEVLNKLVYSLNHKMEMEQIEENLKELLGHTPFEVIMGAVLGVFIGLWLG